MIKTLLLTLTLLVSTNTLGCSITGVGDLPESVQQQLKISCEQAKLEVKTKAEETSSGIISMVTEATDGELTIEKVSAIGQVAKDIAMAIGIAARELGVSVNEFLGTPAGIILYKVVGATLISFFTKLILVAICFWMSYKAANKFRYKGTEEKVYKNWLGNDVTKQVVTYHSWDELEDSSSFLMFLFTVIPFIVLLIAAI